MKTTNVTLLQPRSAWGKHIYLINGLLATATRLSSAGIECALADMNVYEDLPAAAKLNKSDWVGIGILGAPYIPQAFALAKDIRALGYTKPILFGGPVLKNISNPDWTRLFEANNLKNAIAIRDEVDLKIFLGQPNLPSIYQCSMADTIANLPEAMKQAYFGKEFCIFTSDGCIYNCSFCAALNGQEEGFRDSVAFRNEMSTIAEMVRQYAGTKPDYEIYLSTLDGLQNPEQMEPMLRIISEEFRTAGTFVPIRFLATSGFTYKALMSDPDILKRWAGYGVQCIGLGVDGADEESWQKLRKGHNKPDEIQAALLGIQEAGMVAEALMVIGFPGESAEASIKAMKSCRVLAEQGIKVRPYLGKQGAPGTVGFSVEPYLRNTNLFLQLDYSMVGSQLTHPDEEQRRLVNQIYIDTIDWLNINSPHKCPTNPLFPTEEEDLATRQRHRHYNEQIPIDR